MISPLAEAMCLMGADEARKAVRAPDCCDDENNHFEDDSECVVCYRCKEWTCETKCRVCCDETISESGCCS